MLVTLGHFPVEEVLPFTCAGAPRKLYRVNNVLYKVNMSSLRYQTFRKGLICVECGIIGNIFLLQSVGSENPHFNLYHIDDNNMILITKDHIIPKSKNGPDRIDNLQTMCIICNMKKVI